MGDPAQRRPRLPAWESLLADFLQAAAARPFAWGSHDCCTFAADAVQAITGVDMIASLRGQWADAAGAAKAVKRLGGMRTALQRHLGEPLPSPLWAQRGDVVLIRMDGRHSAGICAGAVVVGAAEVGLARLTLTDAAVLAAWSV